MLRAVVGAWFAPGRLLALAEPSVRQLQSGATTAAARKAEAMTWVVPGGVPGAHGEDAHNMCWDLVGEWEVVLEGGVQQVGRSHALAGSQLSEQRTLA